MKKVGLIWLCLIWLLAGCSTSSKTPLLDEFHKPTSADELDLDANELDFDLLPVDDTKDNKVNFDGGIFRGSGVFVNKNLATRKPVRTETGEVTLNFDNADIREVIKAILGDILGENYTIDPGVKGTVSVQTQQKITKQAVLPMLETLLRMNGVVLLRDGQYYKAMPVSMAARGAMSPRLSSARETGYGSRIFPLKYIAAAEMMKIVAPLLPDDGSVKIIEGQNLLLINGTGPELNHVAETIAIFDVDWLAGMSIALFPVENTDPKSLATELEQLVSNDKSPISGMVRMVPIERLNSLLVMSPQADYLVQVGAWVKRLDQAQNEAGQRMYVYYVQNAKASELADLLNDIVSGSGKTKKSSKVKLSPKTKSVDIKSKKRKTAKKSQHDGIAYGDMESVRVIADDVNNALLIMADPQGYRLIMSALKKLDITPLQVLVEVTIAEVVLNDGLRYGVQWYFKDTAGNGRRRAGMLNFGSAADKIANVVPSFTYLLTKAGNDSVLTTRGILDLLANESDVKVISSPSILVLNNKDAEMNVGQEVPVLTQQKTDTSTDGEKPFVVNSIQYKETGVLLTVTPRVNKGGLVTMDVTQEVSNAVSTTVSGIDSPTIQKRTVKTIVSVQSGQSVLLGGMIQEQKQWTESGFPILHTIPVIGALFGKKESKDSRTELLVIITPKVIDTHRKAQSITEEYKRRMRRVTQAQREFM